jgi:hypothetical protein
VAPHRTELSALGSNQCPRALKTGADARSRAAHIGLGGLLVSVAGAILLSACGSQHAEFVQIRAAHDFECVQDGIEVEEIARSRYRAQGCGKEAEYVCAATPDGVDCSQSKEL